MYGEVKTLRAMFYLDLIRTWGDVVFVTEPTESTDDFFSRGTTNRDKILEFLIDDLIAAEPMMKYAADLDYGVTCFTRILSGTYRTACLVPWRLGITCR